MARGRVSRRPVVHGGGAAGQPRALAAGPARGLVDQGHQGQRAVGPRGFDFGAVEGLYRPSNSSSADGPPASPARSPCRPGRQPSDYAVVVFPEDEDEMGTRAMAAGARITRPGLDGAYKLPGPATGTLLRARGARRAGRLPGAQRARPVAPADRQGADGRGQGRRDVATDPDARRAVSRFGLVLAHSPAGDAQRRPPGSRTHVRHHRSCARGHSRPPQRQSSRRTREAGARVDRAASASRHRTGPPHAARPALDARGRRWPLPPRPAIRGCCTSCRACSR